MAQNVGFDQSVLCKAQRRFVAFWTLVLLLTSLISTIPAGLQMEAEIGFDGFYVPGEWTPVQVILSNVEESTDIRPPQDLVGVLSVRSDSVGSFVFDARPFLFEQEVELPASSQKRIWVLAKVGGSDNGQAPLVHVEFRATNRRARVEESHRAIPLPMDQRLALMVRPGLSLGGMNLPGVASSPSYQLASVSAVPDHWAAYQGVDLIFMTASSFDRLQIDQADALREWVRRGGVLVVDGGAGGDHTASLLSDLLPVDVTERHDFQVNPGGEMVPLEAEGTMEQGRTTTLLGALPRTGARVLWGREGEALAALAPSGMGSVGFVAWALTDTIMGNNPQAVVAVDAMMPRSMQVFDRERFNQILLRNIIPDPDIKPPSVFLVLLLLLVYFAIVGPGNFIYLKRRNRLEWAWITIPAIIVVFCVAFFAIGYLTRSNSDSLRHINVAHVLPGEDWARVDGLSVYFSATKQRIDFEPSDPEATLSLATFWNPEPTTERYDLHTTDLRRNIQMRRLSTAPATGRPTRVHTEALEMSLPDEQVNQWDFTYLETQGVVALGGSVEVRCEVFTDSGQGLGVRGEIHNGLPHALKNAALVWGGTVLSTGPPDEEANFTNPHVMLSRIEPGETVTFASSLAQFRELRELETNLIQDDPTNIEFVTHRSVTLNDVDLPWLNQNTGRMLFTAFVEEALLEVEADSQAERSPPTTLLVTPVALSVIKPMEFTLTDEMMQRSRVISAKDPRHVGRSVESGNVNNMGFGGPMGTPPSTPDTATGHLTMRSNASVLLRYRIPWDDEGVETDIGSVSVRCVYNDSRTTNLRLLALRTDPGAGEQWLEIPIRVGPGDPVLAEGMPIHDPISLPPSQVVNPNTGEITLVLLAEPDPSVTRSEESLIVRDLELVVSGSALPIATIENSNQGEEAAR